MTYATKFDLMSKAKERRYCDVTIPGYGTYRIQSMTELERSQTELLLMDENKEKAITYKSAIIAACLVDDKGNVMFADHEIGLISDLDCAVTNCLFDAIAAHNSIDVDGTKKNLEIVPADSTPCDLQPELVESM